MRRGCDYGMARFQLSRIAFRARAASARIEGDHAPPAHSAKACNQASAQSLGEAALPEAHSRKRISTPDGSGTNATRSSSKRRSWTRQASAIVKGLPSMEIGRAHV